MDFVVVKINGCDVSKRSHADIVNAFRTAKDPIVVEVIRRTSTLSKEESNFVPLESPKFQECSTQTEWTLFDRQQPDGGDLSENRTDIECEGLFHDILKPDIRKRSNAETGFLCSDADGNLDKLEYQEVKLCRSNVSEKLGLTISSESAKNDFKSNIFVKKVELDSIASRDGRIRKGDQILKINGIDLFSENQAVVLCAENRLDFSFLVARPLNKDDADSMWKKSDFVAGHQHSRNQTQQEEPELGSTPRKVVHPVCSYDDDLDQDLYQTVDETTCLLSSAYDLLANYLHEEDHYENVSYECEDSAEDKEYKSRKCDIVDLDALEVSSNLSSIANDDDEFNQRFKKLEVNGSPNNNWQKMDCLNISSDAEDDNKSRESHGFNAVQWFQEERFKNLSCSSESDGEAKNAGKQQDDPQFDGRRGSLASCEEEQPSNSLESSHQKAACESDTNSCDSCRSVCQDLPAKSKRSSSGKKRHSSRTNKKSKSEKHEIRVMFSPSTTMYTNRANLKHTIWLQQHLFRQAMAGKYYGRDRRHGSISWASPLDAHGNHKDIHFQSSGQRLLSDYGRSPTPSGKREALSTVEEEEEVRMKWKVKRRPDGTRYITRRPVYEHERVTKPDRRCRVNKVQIAGEHQESSALQVKSCSLKVNVPTERGREKSGKLSAAMKKSSTNCHNMVMRQHHGDQFVEGMKIVSRVTLLGRKHESGTKSTHGVLSVTTI